MKNKTVRIIVDIMMIAAVILAYLRWDGDPTAHIIYGIACLIFFAIHFYLNIKTFIALCKAIRKLKPPVKLKCVVDIFLIIVWGVTFITGFIALVGYDAISTAVSGMGRIHGIFARMGSGLILFHIIQHGSQILSYIKGTRNVSK
jgi:hypothetical protein